MVSRREKLKLLQSKAQEQMFNLHVKLLNQELSAGETSVASQLCHQRNSLILDDSDSILVIVGRVLNLNFFVFF